MSDAVLRDEILKRLEAETGPADAWATLVLAALDGPAALAAYLDDGREPARPKGDGQSNPAQEPQGAYLKSIAVEGFRGIGARARLDLPPGPGLTLVVGRNGSGKSSFAEALELLVTGDTYRWAHKAKVWREGWRNLHQAKAAIEAEFHVEGEKGTTRVAAAWAEDAELADAETVAQIQGKKQAPLAELGWEAALATYRPFLSYSELGSMLDAGPSHLYDALSAILGLEELTQAQETLADARKARDKAVKDAGQKREAMLGPLRQMDDARARRLVAALEKKDWGLDEAEAALAEATSGESAGAEVAVLRSLAGLAAPSADAVAAVVRELREARDRQKAAAGTLAARSQALAEILDHALRFHERHGDGDCPVCGREGALDQAWHERQAALAPRLRAAAREANEARLAGESARRKAQALPAPSADLLARAAPVGLDAKDAAQALETWRAAVSVSGSDEAEDLAALADGLESAAGPLHTAVAALRERAAALVQRREDVWRPVVPPLVAWLAEARSARAGEASVKPLKAAEAWLKKAATDLRNERFAPLKESAQRIWNQLRLQSNVSLDDIRLTGAATKRQVELDVTVDGAPGAALGVMSQGEQNALALSLFIPRATLPESPFRFVVIDDPVQSMDPARVDGLARVLHDTSAKRQVVVFTHDDRLPEAVRRLGVPATVVEVKRRGHSAVELRRSRDPVSRYLADADAVLRDEGLPAPAARRVVPGLCRLAVDAACTEVVRRRRLARGEAHAAVEELLTGVKGSWNLAALALFDDARRGGEVIGHLNKKRPSFANAFRAVNEGSHEAHVGPLPDLVSDTRNLAEMLRQIA